MCIYENEIKNYRIKISYDEMAESPREWDYDSKMICFHGRYDLGDKHNFKESDFDDWEDMREKLIKEHDAYVILPLYLYDHSGITMNTTNFNHLGYHGYFDSGQVGYIYMTRERILKNHKVKKVSKKLKEKIEEQLISEVEEYDKFISGRVYLIQTYTLEYNEESNRVEEIDVDTFGNVYVENLSDLKKMCMKESRLNKNVLEKLLINFN